MTNHQKIASEGRAPSSPTFNPSDPPSSPHYWRFFGIWVLVIGVFGCRSAKPPPEPPLAVARSERARVQARDLAEQQNWAAAAAEWRIAAKETSLLNDGAGEATALHNLADAERQLQQYDSAVSNALAAVAINESLGRKRDWWRNQILLLQLEDLQTNRSPAARLDQLQPRIAEVNDPATRGAFWNELGLWQQRQGDLTQAAETFLQAQSEYANANDDAGVATVIANRAKLLEAQGDSELAARMWADALRRFEALAEPVAIAHALLGQGRTLVAAQKDLPQAEINLRRAARNFRHLQMYDEAAEADALVARLTAGQ